MDEKKKILVVEGDVILCDVLAIKFKKLGYTVEKAVDAAVAMQKTRATKPDFIVLDILMARKTGIGFFQELKADAALREIPVLITATSEDHDEVRHAHELGAREFLIKPILDPNAVVEKVQGLIALPAQAVPQVTMATAAVASTPVSTPAAAPLGTPASAPVAPAATGKIFILIIEDDKFLRELLVRKLAAEGFDVQNATDATAAFTILAQRKPNIVLLDLILPEVSGFEILDRIKKDPTIADVPVIILSNLGQKEDTDKAMALGAKDFMVKANFTLDEIAAKVRATLA